MINGANYKLDLQERIRSLKNLEEYGKMISSIGRRTWNGDDYIMEDNDTGAQENFVPSLSNKVLFDQRPNQFNTTTSQKE